MELRLFLEQTDELLSNLKSQDVVLIAHLRGRIRKALEHAHSNEFLAAAMIIDEIRATVDLVVNRAGQDLTDEEIDVLISQYSMPPKTKRFGE